VVQAAARRRTGSVSSRARGTGAGSLGDHPSAHRAPAAAGSRDRLVVDQLRAGAGGWATARRSLVAGFGWCSVFAINALLVLALFLQVRAHQHGKAGPTRREAAVRSRWWCSPNRGHPLDGVKPELMAGLCVRGSRGVLPRRAVITAVASGPATPRCPAVIDALREQERWHTVCVDDARGC
jgi:hypothetical protein